MSKLSIIVPYRDRKSHLDVFIPHMNEYLTSEGIDYNIVIVDQDDGSLFNRAKLLNVGFLETFESSDYSAFHDVDMIPVKPNAGYHFTKTARQVFSPTEYSMGGISIANNTVNLKVNGWSNSYWGWGGEDRNYAHRLSHHGIPLEESRGFRKWDWGREHFKELEGHHDPDRKQLKKTQQKITKSFKKDPSLNDHDGLVNCDYTINFFESYDTHTLIKVNLNEKKKTS